MWARDEPPVPQKDYETYYRGEEKLFYCKSIRDNIFQVIFYLFVGGGVHGLG